MNKCELKEGGERSSETPINRFSIVTTGKRLPKREVESVAAAMAELDSGKIGKCVSLGILDAEDFQILKAAGVNRYHHNLETCKSYFSEICSTHSYEERVKSIKEARKRNRKLWTAFSEIGKLLSRELFCFPSL